MYCEAAGIPQETTQVLYFANLRDALDVAEKKASLYDTKKMIAFLHMSGIIDATKDDHKWL